jgi:hypothetical protein
MKSMKAFLILIAVFAAPAVFAGESTSGDFDATDMIMMREPDECPPRGCDAFDPNDNYICRARDSRGNKFFGHGRFESWACRDALNSCKYHSKVPKSCRIR